jgi:hypothetical protein
VKRRVTALLACAFLAACSNTSSGGNSPPAKHPKPNSNQNPDYGTP